MEGIVTELGWEEIQKRELRSARARARVCVCVGVCVRERERETERDKENGVACASNYDLYSIMQFATELMTDCFIGHMNINSDHI
jgi:hypothetical protein